MVDDCEIKTKVSPFAMRTQEIKVFDGKDGYVSMNQIIQKINLLMLHFTFYNFAIGAWLFDLFRFHIRLF